MPLYLQTVYPPAGGMTTTRVEVASTGLQLVDYSNFIYDGTNLAIGARLDVAVAGTLSLGTATANAISAGNSSVTSITLTATGTSGTINAFGKQTFIKGQDTANGLIPLVTDTLNTYTSVKLASFRNNTAEQFAVDWAGNLLVAAGSGLTLLASGTLNIGTSNVTTLNIGSAGSTSLAMSIGRVTITQAALAALTNTSALTLTAGAHTNATASAEWNDVNINLARTLQWATGNITTQRAILIQAPTYAFVGASTITDAATLDITGPPIAGTNATLTNAWALRMESGIAGWGSGGTAAAPTASGTRSAGTRLVIFPQPASFDYSMGIEAGNMWFLSASGFKFYAASTTSSIQINSSGNLLINTGNTLDTVSAATLNLGTATANAITMGNSTVGTAQLTAQQFTLTQNVSTSGQAFRITGAAHTTLVNEYNDVWFNLNRTINWSGTLPALNRSILISPTTFSAGSSGTIATAVTMEILGSPVAGTNMTITNRYGLRVFGGLYAQSNSGNGIIATEDNNNGVYLSYQGSFMGLSNAGSAYITQRNISSATPTLLTITGGVLSTLNATFEAIDININLNRAVQFATGAIATQRAIVIQPPTYSFVASSTISKAATLAITGQPVAGTNATITRAFPLMINWDAVAAGITQTAISVRNDTAATAGVQVQNSPGIALLGSAWTGSVSNTSEWIIQTQPSNSNPVWSFINFACSNNGGTYTSYASLDSSGGSLTVAGNFITSNGGSGGSVLASLFDTVSGGGALSIGTSNASSITVGRSAATSITVQAKAITVRGTDAANGATPFTFDTTNTYTGGNLLFKIATGGTVVSEWDNLGNIYNVGGGYDIITSGEVDIGTRNATSIVIGRAGLSDLTLAAKRYLFNQNATSGATLNWGWRYNTAAHTNLTASTEAVDFMFDANRVVQFATGAISTQRSVIFNQPTYAFVGASTITTAATVWINGPPTAGTNATITGSWALWVNGNTIIKSTSGNGFVSVDDSTGAYLQYGSDIISVNNTNIQMTAASGSVTASTQQFNIGQQVLTSGQAFRINGAIHTALTAGTEYNDIWFNLTRNITFGTGNLTNQRSIYIGAPTLNFAAASTVTNAATVYIESAPIAGTNATITNGYGLWALGNSRFSGIVYVNGTIDTEGATNMNIGLTKCTNIRYGNFGGTFTYHTFKAGVDAASGGTIFTASDGYTHYGVDPYGLPSLGNRFEWREDWLGIQSNTGITTSGTIIPNTSGKWYYNGTTNGTGVTAITNWDSTLNTCSYIRMDPGTTSGNFCCLANYTAVFSIPNSGGSIGNVKIVMEWSMNGVAGSTTTYGGVGNQRDPINTGGFGFMYRGGTDTHWQAITNNTSSSQFHDTGVTPTTAASQTMQFFRIEYYGPSTPYGATTIKYYINNALTNTVTNPTINLSYGNQICQFSCKQTATASSPYLVIGPVMVMYNQVAQPLVP